ncbi:adenylyltransferase/sulfurtransferase MoeZ [Cryobacterium sp. TMT2-17-1]|uniref:Adenylyltransferase/sulfurtransferase MoeZ n=1 Tax=Cryobacterium sandaracinum TaxID=1259247 RepID=A0ABY2J8N8_9MICO|nr:MULTISPECIES: ThiF family adenylyltransferase [Cryobacterium]TFC38842.1 adenylyltransferase/sulfurtransferase MoeZ [Cryobacterium sp. TMT2-14]TFC54396.1 adenylyltransferase/sulfurtransferase MoeZ [Cryobacterium sp. TMT2-17-1]TFC66945.1 adenylyltransferase/sulfurtransferase MoeZ [Cryobacterium sp. TMT2-4]TFD01205.1 adenylyltransferase/sulfurtransferase MoeZ [Cryobacterium sandaracinum]
MAIPPLVEPIARLSGAESVRTARQRRLPQLNELGQRRLANARVLVLGAGGLGSPALIYLAAAGVGTIGIVDGDDVEPSNLQRQIVHGQADVGRPKVASAAESIAQIAPEAVVVQHAERLDAGNAAAIIGGYDVVIDGTDNFPTRFLVNDTCAALGLPLVWASVLRFDAQLSVFWATPPAESGLTGVHLRDLFPTPPTEGEVPNCAEAGVLGALCGQVGSLMATEAIKLIAGIGAPLIGRVLVIDALSGRFTEVPLIGTGIAAADPNPAATLAAARGSARAATAGAWSTLTPVELVARLTARAEGTDPFVLVDVREPDEHAESAIPDAVLLPLGDLLTEAGMATLPRDVPLVLHCHLGPRAERAAMALDAAGFTGLTLLAGGIVAWDVAVAARTAPGRGSKWAGDAVSNESTTTAGN